MAKELFLEIGSEEIPAGFLPVAMADLEKLIRKEFDNASLEYGAITTYATPRRLVLAVAEVAEEQPTRTIQAMGPAKKVAFGEDGTPTKAGAGFARGQGVDPSELKIVSTDKGEYVCAEKVETGRKTAELLQELLPRLIGNLTFRKSMRWKDLDIRYARPLHWIVALYGGAAVPFSYGNLESGVTSRGHRFMAPEEFPVGSLKEYLAEAEKRFVIVDQDRRKAMIAAQVEEAANQTDGKLVPDAGLLEEVTYLVEYPQGLLGTFDEEFRELPRELLITSMRAHQRYFSVEGQDGRLLPVFITVANTVAEDPKVVVAGNQRVIRARLSDAMFFWKEDQKARLESRLDALKNVVYQAKLGTSYAKVMRFKTLALELAEKLDADAVKATGRAAELAKCDLESAMVYEFPELQGVMGREYALLDGEDPRVATAIYEHYLPVEAGGAVPSDNVGAFVSLADKIDTICGCFGVGLIPTGSADPYALRRSAIGILSILLDRDLSVSLRQLIGRSVELLEEKLTRPAAEVRNDVLEFIRLRLFNMLTAQDYPNDVVDAVLSASFDDPLDAVARVKALAELKGEADFEPLAVAFKRVVNIIKGGVETPVDEALFEEACEGKLAAALASVNASVEQAVAAGDYTKALQAIATLRGPVDDFFEGVMVMAEDERVKANRLALLTMAARIFADIADFSKIAA
ncbi:MAG: glycine--tRNA ligase subunit beta [Desulfuromonas sp.]|nr:MAG: glycine--tRNA ligase subunit beta [Desulfuromonas sp.]